MNLGALPGVQALALSGVIADTREAVAYAVSRVASSSWPPPETKIVDAAAAVAAP